MHTKKKIKHATRFFHRGLGRYLYAKDYGYQSWPIGSR